MIPATTPRNSDGNYFEDLVALYRDGTTIRHATPRQITAGDVAQYSAIFGGRHAAQSDDKFAQSIGFERAPINSALAFHMGFGKTVPDVSLNAIANLGYADVQFKKPLYVGDSIVAETQVIGYKENLDKEDKPRGDGNVYVKSTVHRVGDDGRQEEVLSFNRWVMVRKRDKDSALPEGMEKKVIPDLPKIVDAQTLAADFPAINVDNFDPDRSGSAAGFEQYEVGQKINHGQRREIGPEHREVPNLSGNDALVHFAMGKIDLSRPVVGSNIVYGGHIISMAQTQSFYGLQNALAIVGINGGTHANPCFQGETVSSWSEILDKQEVPGRSDIGLLRVRTVAAKNLPAGGFPEKNAEGKFPLTPTDIVIGGQVFRAKSGVVLDMDYWVAVPRGLAPATPAAVPPAPKAATHEAS